MNLHVYANVRKCSEIVNIQCDVVTVCFRHELGCQASDVCLISNSYRGPQFVLFHV